MAAAPDQHQNLRIAVSARACPPPMSTAYVAPSLGARPPRHAVAAPVVPLRKRAAGLRARRCEFKRPPYRVESALRRPVGVGTLCAYHCPIEVRRSTGHEPARLSVAASSRFPVTRQPSRRPAAVPGIAAPPRRHTSAAGWSLWTDETQIRAEFREEFRRGRRQWPWRRSAATRACADTSGAFGGFLEIQP